MTRRRTGAAALVLAVAVALAGCVAEPSPQELRAEAGEVFDDLVGVLAEEDTAVLRAVTAQPAAEQACEIGEEAGTQSALVATATLGITAADAEIAEIADDLGGRLEEPQWDRIRAADGADGQAAWASESGVVVTVTAQGPALVVAVFTPCRR